MSDLGYTPNPDELIFLPLGGSSEIGMNLNLYHFAGKWLMVDLGITFGDDTTPGIKVLVPNPKYIEKHKKNLLTQSIYENLELLRAFYENLMV